MLRTHAQCALILRCIGRSVLCSRVPMIRPCKREHYASPPARPSHDPSVRAGHAPRVPGPSVSLVRLHAYPLPLRPLKKILGFLSFANLTLPPPPDGKPLVIVTTSKCSQGKEKEQRKIAPPRSEKERAERGKLVVVSEPDHALVKFAQKHGFVYEWHRYRYRPRADQSGEKKRRGGGVRERRSSLTAATAVRGEVAWRSSCSPGLRLCTRPCSARASVRRAPLLLPSPCRRRGTCWCPRRRGTRWCPRSSRGARRLSCPWRCTCRRSVVEAHGGCRACALLSLRRCR